MSTSENTVSLAALMESRIGTYSLISRLFRVEVDEALLQDLKSGDFTADVESQEIVEGYALWRKLQTNLSDHTLLDLAVDYAQIFIGTGNTAKGAARAAYPYESVYTSPLKLMMQEARDEVLALYRSEGIAKIPEFCDPEDHIALELAFMVILNRRFQELFKEGRVSEALDSLRKQQRFLNEHLLNWAPRFCADVERIAQSDLYKGLAKVTEGFLRIDQIVLAELLEELTVEAA